MEDMVFSSDSYSFGVRRRLPKHHESSSQPIKACLRPKISIISCISERESPHTPVKNLKSQRLTEDKKETEALLKSPEILRSEKRVPTKKVTPYIHRKCHSRNINVLTSKEDLLKEIEKLKQTIESMETEQANIYEQFAKALRLLKEQVLLEKSRRTNVESNLQEKYSFETFEIDTKNTHPPTESARQLIQRKYRVKRRTNSEIDSRNYVKRKAKSNETEHITADTCQCIVF